METIAQDDLRRGLGWSTFGAVMGAAFLVPWKLAAGYGEPHLAVLVLLTSGAVANSLWAAVLAWQARRGEANEGASWFATCALAVAFAGLTLVGNACSAESIARISGALLAVIQRCEVLLVALMGALFLREKVGSAFWLGTGVAGFGLWLLKGGAAAGGSLDPLGVLFGLGTAACFGGMVLLARAFIRRVYLLPFNALRLWLSVLLWGLVEGGLPPAEQLPWDLVLFGSLAGLIGPFMSRLGLLQSGRYIPAQLTALSALTCPVFALLLAYLFLGELPTGREVLGGSVMLLGVAIPLSVSAWQARLTLVSGS